MLLPPVSLLETLPQPVLEKALWWEGHSLEILHGQAPDVSQGTKVRPEYAPTRSLTARERAKAAELTAAGHKASVSTVGNYRRRYQSGGMLGLADHRPVRKTPPHRAVDDRVIAAMRQAIVEAVDNSTRTGTFLLWRTGEILKSTEEGRQVQLPSRATLYRLLDKLTTGTAHPAGWRSPAGPGAHAGGSGPLRYQVPPAPGRPKRHHSPCQLESPNSSASMPRGRRVGWRSRPPPGSGPSSGPARSGRPPPAGQPPECPGLAVAHHQADPGEKRETWRTVHLPILWLVRVTVLSGGPVEAPGKGIMNAEQPLPEGDRCPSASFPVPPRRPQPRP